MNKETSPQRITANDIAKGIINITAVLTTLLIINHTLYYLLFK
jgi:hypothetical protein